jgi:regulator of sigma E protease
MPAFILYPLSFLLVLGVMIVVHEWGHYAAAKLLGVRVEVFSVGFGPRLLGFRRGDTDYRISAIPLGGYVKMSGENPMDEATGDPGEFMSHPRWHRFIIAAAGPFMNIALAVGLLTGLYTFHFERPASWDAPALVGWVKDGGPAAKVGVQPGDLISDIDGIPNPKWEQTLYKTVLSPGQPLHVGVQRGTQALSFTIVPEATGVDRYGSAGWYPQEPIEVTAISKNMPAAKAGVQLGDVITSADGVALKALPALFQHLQDTKGKPVELAVLRNGQEMKFTVQPVLDRAEGSTESFYRMGVGSERMKIVQMPLGEAWKTSLEENRKSSFLVLQLLNKLVHAKVSIKQVEGPIRIGQAAGDAVQEGLENKGWFHLLELGAAISLNLGIFNLMPIPIMDGGVILLLLLEGLMRRDISLVVKERIYQTAFVFLVLFASVVIFNDVSKVFGSGRLP